MKLYQYFLYLTLSFSVAVPFSYAQNQPEDTTALMWLQNMSRALRQLDYRGLFTYEHGGALRTMRITHQVSNGSEYEVLEHLNGPAFRIERAGDTADCLTPAEQVLRGLIPTIQSSDSLLEHYQLVVRGRERVAGRDAVVVQIRPKDRYRYGYSLILDRASSLPLSSMIINGRERVLERLQFSQLELTPTDDWVELVGDAAYVKKLKWPLCGNSHSAKPFDWSVSWVPEGFVDAGRASFNSIGDVVLYTDGLAAFSVFVLPQSSGEGAQGRAQRGATVAYMKQVEFNGSPYTVTVVGEIPARTAQRVAASIFVPAPKAGEEVQKPAIDQPLDSNNEG